MQQLSNRLAKLEEKRVGAGRCIVLRMGTDNSANDVAAFLTRMGIEEQRADTVVCIRTFTKADGLPALLSIN